MTNIEELYKKAIDALNNNNLDESAKMLDQILQEKPDHPGAYFRRAGLYKKVHQLEKARENY